MNRSELPAELRELLTVVHDALDVPLPARPEDQAAEERLRQVRVVLARETLRRLTGDRLMLLSWAEEADLLRQLVATEYPVTYEPYQLPEQPGGER
ncbi:hypothetical protein FH609_011805 [Streptomyces sp. 3MP-14]|uniref:Uncharacterized protein n=1 Tax=Streptomyces mimosae TaxID=2586635 RepID=A0A5N6AHQ6_9ACTN|nr:MULTISPECIES: hypothetical protein [Streptomyces]KAB8167078.1 hypothetical protein FH607_009255 [Streptomyces mimosae]KAB8177019.1 hypothetical protein FH609_011805 [Streptomyces sp. 3MP-14]